MDATVDFIKVIAEILPHDPKIARVMVVSAFTNVCSMLTPEGRLLMIGTMCELAKIIGDEKFEDGNDFVSFLTEAFSSPIDTKPI